MHQVSCATEKYIYVAHLVSCATENMVDRTTNYWVQHFCGAWSQMRHINITFWCATERHIFVQEIGKYEKKSLIMVKSGISQNLSLQNIFQRSLRNSSKTMSNEKVLSHKVVENFVCTKIDINFIQIGHRMLPLCPDYCGGPYSFGTPKVGDGFDPNSFHSWRFRSNQAYER